MNVKVLFYSSASIIGVVVTIAALGALMSMLNQVTATISGTLLPTNTNLFCSRDSDCKQDPNDCSNCVNILSGGFTLLSKCSSAPINCYCVGNRCLNETAVE